MNFVPYSGWPLLMSYFQWAIDLGGCSTTFLGSKDDGIWKLKFHVVEPYIRWQY